MPNIAVSKLINDFQHSHNTTSQLILAEIKQAQSRVGIRQLLIEIDTDDDFSVDGTSDFSKTFDLGDRDIVEVYKEAIKSIKFGRDNEKNHRAESFLEYIMTEEALNEVATGHLSTGGNQTIYVTVVEAPKTMSFGSLVIDLTQ